MKIFSNLLIICLFCHTRAFLYPGLETFKTNPKDVYKDKLDDQQKDKANSDEVEMDWNALIETADNKDMVKEWYEGLFASDLDEEEIEENLAHILEIPENITFTITGFSEKDAKLIRKITSEKMKKIHHHEKTELSRKKHLLKKMENHIPNPNVESLKTRLNENNEEAVDWDALKADDITKVKEVYKGLLDTSGDERITKKKLDIIIRSSVKMLMQLGAFSRHDAELIQNIAYDIMKKIRRYEVFHLQQMEKIRMREQEHLKEVKKMISEKERLKKENAGTREEENLNHEQEFNDSF